MSGPLPQRWRQTPEAEAHNRAICGILDTPPITPQQDGLVLFSTLGSTDILSFLVAVKSLWHRIGRGRVAVLDDGTLTAQDRTILAQHCGDPELVRGADVAPGPFPRIASWQGLLTVLDRRAGEYWLRLDSDIVASGELTEIERAIASNRGFLLVGPGDRASQSGDPAPGEPGARIESHLGDFPGAHKLRYVRADTSLCGFAAGGTGRDLAAAFLGHMKAGVGEQAAASPESLATLTALIIANDGEPVLLPASRYASHRGSDPGGRIEASRRAIANLG